MSAPFSPPAAALPGRRWLDSFALPWTIFALTALLIVASGAATFAIQRTLIREQVRTQLTAIAEGKVDGFRSWLMERRRDAYSIGHEPFFAEGVAAWLRSGAPAGDTAMRIEAALAELVTAHSYEGVILFDAHGEQRLAVGTNTAVDTEDRDQAVDVLRHGQVSFSGIHAPRGDSVLDLSVPLFAEGKGALQPVAAVLLRVDTGTLTHTLIRPWPVSSATAEAFIVGGEGDDVVFLTDRRDDARTQDTSAPRPAGGAGTLPAAMAVRGIEGIVEGTDYRGVPVVAALRALPDTPWHLVAKIDSEEAYAPVRKLVLTLGSLASLAIALTAALVFAWSRAQQAWQRAREAQLDLERQALVKHYDYLAKFANDIIVLADESGRIVEANDSAVRSYGYAREELLRLDLRDLDVPGSPAKNLTREHEPAMEGALFETVHVRNDGSGFPVEVSARAIDVEGRRLVQCIVRDITERVRAGEVLAEERNKAQRYLDVAGVMLLALDAGGKVVLVNKRGEQFLGCSEEEIVGRDWIEAFVPQHDRAQIREVFRRAMAGHIEEVEYFENPVVSQDGGERLIAWHNAVVRNAAGEIAGTLSSGEDITERERARQTLKQQSIRLAGLLTQTVQAMALTIEKRDAFTAGHQKGVSDLAAAIAEDLGLSGGQIEGLRFAASIHDVGILVVPAEYLNRPGPLNDDEFALVKAHAGAGYDIVKSIEFPWPVAQMLLQHHERLDGSGYPQGLKGESILLEARILAVADVLEAMLSHRPYRPAHDLDAALEEITSNAGVLYDPRAAQAAVTLFRVKQFAFHREKSAEIV